MKFRENCRMPVSIPDTLNWSRVTQLTPLVDPDLRLSVLWEDVQIATAHRFPEKQN